MILLQTILVSGHRPLQVLGNEPLCSLDVLMPLSSLLQQCACHDSFYVSSWNCDDLFQRSKFSHARVLNRRQDDKLLLKPEAKEEHCKTLISGRPSCQFHDTRVGEIVL
jgi:hypothetical protein